MQKYNSRLMMIAKRRLKQDKGKWIPANLTQNLSCVQQQYKKKLPSIKYRDISFGFTSSKNPKETPYTAEGRQLYFNRTRKRNIQARLDEVCSEKAARAACYGK